MTPLLSDRADVTELVQAAGSGDQQAWNSLVDRYMPLVVAITRKFRLTAADQEDVSQSVWLKLVRHVQEIREPRALPGWISTTTRNLCLQTLSSNQRVVAVDTSLPTWEGIACDEGLVDQELLRLEQQQAVRDGLAELKGELRDLLLMLVQDPPLSYQEISQALGIPVGSIGPTRARCLRKLRETDALRAFLDRDPSSVG